jgi:hypothetical protein
MATTTFFRIGTLYIEVSTSSLLPDLQQLLPSFTPFVCLQPEEETALKVTIRTEEEVEPALTAPTTSLTSFEWEGATCHIEVCADDPSCHVLRIIPPVGREYVAVCSKRFTEADIRLHGTSEDTFVLNNLLMMLYAFMAAPHGVLMMHASVIKHAGHAYLFLGKSGTGKSTHSSLWLKHIPDCELLNDDNPLVKVDAVGHHVQVFGSPWSGKTPCYRNEEAAAGAFVRLEQAPFNQISKVKAAPAFSYLYPSCSCLREDAIINSSIINSITKAIEAVPVFHLKCLPNKEAALLCYETVVKGGEGREKGQKTHQIN